MGRRVSKVAIGFGVSALVIGFGQVVGDTHMCRGSCWIDNIFTALLPKDLDYLSGGISWFIVGLGIIIYEFFGPRSKD